jgi:tol-pal system beta propeller repeat protein TolB
VPSFVVVADADVAISFTVDCSAVRRVAYVANGGPGSDIHFIDTDGTGFPLAVAGADSNPAWARSGTELAFASSRDGNTEIYRMNPDGSGVVRLTNDPNPDYRPAWSPDGTRIAFVSERDGNAEIYVMSRDGTGLQRLTTDPGLDTEPAWSPDGTRLAFVSNRSGMPPQIYVMNADGSGVQLRSVAVTGDRTPAWSPDGSLIAFSRRVSGGSYQLFVMEQSGVRPRLLTGAYLSDAPLNPDWSPDSFEIVFSFGYCDFYYGCSSELAVLEIIGAETRILVTGGEPNVSDPAWRP